MVIAEEQSVIMPYVQEVYLQKGTACYGYNKEITIKEIELCLKIDKTIDFTVLTSKDKKRITKQLKHTD